MKQYGQRMREGLTTLLTDSTVDAHYEVNFSVAEGLTLTQNDSEAIKVSSTCRLHFQWALSYASINCIYGITYTSMYLNKNFLLL
jgi:hypothetical protein